MRVSRWAQLAPLTGVGFVVLFAASTVLIDNYVSTPPGDEIKGFFEDGSSMIRWGSYLGVLSVAFLLWFAGVVRSSLRVAEGETGRLSAVAFGGGVAAGVLMTVAYAALAAAAVRTGSTGGIAAETATAHIDISLWLSGPGAAMAFAVFIAAAAVVGFRTGVLPRWLVWASAVVALGLLSPASYLLTIFAVLWVLIVSILLYLRGRIEAPAEPA